MNLLNKTTTTLLTMLFLLSVMTISMPVQARAIERGLKVLLVLILFLKVFPVPKFDFK